MNRVIYIIGILVMACGGLVIAQNTDAKKVLADIRTALGGEEKLAAVKTITAEGRSSRVSNGTSAAPTDFELAAELPGKFMKKDVMGVMMGAEITRTSGFNENTPLEAIETPPGMFGGGSGHMVVRQAGGGTMSSGTAATPLTPAQEAENTHKKLIAAKQDFARLTLGMFATSFSSYPLQFTYGGQAESPDGKADIIEIKGEGDFAAKLFVDGKSHLPLLLSWMQKAPVAMNMGGAPTVIPGNAAGGATRTFTSSGSSTVSSAGQATSPQDRDKMIADMEARMRQAEAEAKLVEYRIYYGDYRKVDGISLPHHLQRSIDGDLIEDLTLEKVKVNGKIDPKKFEVKKSS